MPKIFNVELVVPSSNRTGPFELWLSRLLSPHRMSVSTVREHTPHTPTEPPKDRRVLIKYRPLYYHAAETWTSMGGGEWLPSDEPCWVECRWVDNKEKTGSDPHWEPWTGNQNTFSSDHIKPFQVIDWSELPG